ATGDPVARAAAATLRSALQERFRQDGAMFVLDESSPTGYRLWPALNYPQMHASDPEVRRRWRQNHFGRWFRALPVDWTPPPPAPNGGIPEDLPLRADRAPYRWPPLPG
ncbi:MAG TPA: hypothetical protein VL172_08630, partial [Kofleriaceae bacterium]|nr:hypothetical protein [Kofleriaceae bacterium]